MFFNDAHIVTVYNLMDGKGNHLRLMKGYVDPSNKCPPADRGARWCFMGSNIPMPVRSGYWFNGFSVDTMLLWLTEHGWHVAAEVNMSTGKAKMHALPEPEESYADEEFAEDKTAFNNILKELNRNGKFGIAMQLYSYAHEVGHQTAREAVREICQDTTEVSKSDELTDVAISLGEQSLKLAVNMLVVNGHKMSAIALYRYIYRCKILEAKKAIEAMIQE